ncbi:hypothetical protein MMC21_008333 [Puttea exsequens]|nr:hypothetical protein [Puttea exsequens]
MQGIHSPSPISYVSPKVLSREANDTPPNPMKLNSSVRRTGTERTIKAQHMEHTVDPRVASLSVKSGYNQRPPPLTGQTGDIAPRVRFANEVDDLNRISFLSMTDSPSSCASSEQASPVSPMVHAFAPPPSKEQLAFYQQPSVVPSELSPGAEPVAPGLSGDVPPHLATPDFGRAFFELPSTSVDGGNLQRGVSVMSNRSALTVASSEIDADWTIGSARAVSIYPSVAQQDDKSPPYAEKLRSKYGRYPKGRRDKALPDIPRSPLYQISFDSR